MTESLYSPLDVAWFSGLFEGEGSFVISNGIAKRIAISMTDKDILDRVEAIFGGTVYPLATREEHWKPAWLWQVGGAASVPLVEAMLPLLGERRKKRATEYLLEILSRQEKRAAVVARRTARDKEAVRLRDEEKLSLREIGSRMGLDHGHVGHIVRRAHGGHSSVG